MQNKVRLRKAQFSLEFAVVILALVGALVAMQFYITRSIQGRLRGTADNIGQQYDPVATTGDFTTAITGDTTTIVTTTEEAGRTITTTESRNSYMLDPEGNPVLDENGNPVQIPETHTTSGSETVWP